MSIDLKQIQELGAQARKALDAYGSCVDAFLKGAGLIKEGRTAPVAKEPEHADTSV